MKHGERETRKANIFVPVPNLIVTQTNCSGCRRRSFGCGGGPGRSWLVLIGGTRTGTEPPVGRIFMCLFRVFSMCPGALLFLACKFMVCPKTIVIVFSTFA